jgi:hypothetical protein
MAYAPSPLPDLALTSQSSLAHPTSHPPLTPSPPPSAPPSPPYMPSLEEFNAQSKELQLEVPPGQNLRHSNCTSCPGLRDSISILQYLVFAVRKDIDDLHFRLEQLDQRTEQIDSLLVTLLRSLHSPELGINSPTSSGTFLSPDI